MKNKNELMENIEIIKKRLGEAKECYKAIHKFKTFKEYTNLCTKDYYVEVKSLLIMFDKNIFKKKLDSVLTYLDDIANEDNIDTDVSNNIKELANSLSNNKVSIKDMPINYYIDMLNNNQCLINKFNIEK